MNSGFEGPNKSIIDRLLERQAVFILVFFAIFTLSYLFLLAIDFVPEPVAKTVESKIEQGFEEETPVAEDGTNPIVIEPELPQSMYIEKLDKTINVLNPISREVPDLDRALLSGVVRHPDSALLGQQGTVFILGHSSYLPTVFNHNFQAFNGIQDLEWGDTIEISSGDVIFVYRVDKVYRAEAGELLVPIAGTENKLTLATCDSFGSKSSRFIVEASQVETKSL